ncbi:MAG: hypothetical protein JWP88_571 [Flaviaesturariibacter sp.]|nr:hypothetical protein [Flaviaesturariibacter sp.]
MKLTLFFTLAVALTACGVNKNVYKSSDFEAKAARHKIVALLPLRITQTGYIGKKETEEGIKAMNDKWGYAFQESLLTYTLKQTSKHKKSPVVDFQAIQKTNALLKDAGLTIDAAYEKQPEELAKLLGVDAVLMTTLEKDKNFSDGVAYGLGAARTVLNVIGKPSSASALGVNASDINMNCYLYNGPDSKLLWKTFRKGGADLPNEVNGIVEYYSNWIAKKLPYRS